MGVPNQRKIFSLLLVSLMVSVDESRQCDPEVVYKTRECIPRIRGSSQVVYFDREGAIPTGPMGATASVRCPATFHAKYSNIQGLS